MTDREYRSQPGISRSELWRLNPDNGGTPEKFRWFMEHPEEPTPALIFGRLVHTIFLTPELLNVEFALAPNVDRRTKAGKEAYADFVASLDGRQEIRSDDLDKAAEMVTVLHNAPFVGKLLTGEGEAEVPFFWKDELTGEDCKIRLDRLCWIGDTPVIVDYKTTQDASAYGFVRSALKYGYDFQAAMYIEGVRICTGKDPRFVFIPQEKEAPFAVNALEADPQFIQRGYDKFRELLGIYHECRTTGNWYGHMGAEPVVSRLILPAWAGGDKF